ncbi:DUF167 family protein [Terasakiella sp. SH-1]|uniref:DUF167 domain-containing protein n=1 Tax=Terasakiella sp. SH-1 TaxID=2560057 RepID=UPI001073291A|nr:DUF167 family protein [Terasakiella sp. SH-1]
MIEKLFVPMEGGVRVCVRLTPKGKKNAINEWKEEAEGTGVFKVSVTAVPEKGKANAALIKLLSKEWKLAKSDIEIRAGETSRNKTLLLRGDVTALTQRLTEWMKQNNV